MAEYFTYRQAARRVRRSVRTIKRWRKGGMPMSWQNGFRVVELQTLLAWWRDRMSADPVHQQRLRKMLREESERHAE